MTRVSLARLIHCGIDAGLQAFVSPGMAFDHAFLSGNDLLCDKIRREE